MQPGSRLLGHILEALSSDLRAVLHHLLGSRQISDRILGSLASRDSTNARKILHWQSNPPDYDGFFDSLAGKLHQRALAFDQERAESVAVLQELLDQPVEQQWELATQSERYCSLAVCERLLELGRERSFENPRKGEALARLAVAIAHRLDTRQYGPHIVRDLKARAWSEIGNARRLRSDLSGAERAFQRACQFLRSSLDPLEAGRIYSLKAELLKDQRRFDESLRLRDRAIKIYRRFHQDHLVGRTLTNKASTYLEMGEPEKAIEALQSAVQSLDPTVEPRMLLCARHNLALALADLGRFLEARSVVAASRELYRLSQDPADDYRRLWLEGIIATGLGQLEEAESSLLAARDGFIQQETVYDVALIGLDLAAVYARQHRHGDVKRLAAQIVPIFASRDIQRETFAALAFFKQAADREKLTEETLREIASFLRRADCNRALCFERP